MARQIHKLTAKQADALATVGRHSDGGGLYLSISANGGRRWVFLFRWNGKPREMGLGSTRDVTLKRARDLAAEARKLIGEGVNPLAQKHADAKAVEEESRVKEVPTFAEAADRLLESIENEFRNAKHRDQWRMTLTEYCAPIRDTRTNEISTDDVLRILAPIWRTKSETASRIRGRIERVIDAARALDADKSRWGFNPATWRGNLEPLLGKRLKLQRGHHAAMPWRDVPAFFQRVQEFDSISQMALAFLILNASRSGEVLGATWSEFDLDAATWTIPAARMKAGKEHVVPLSEIAIIILGEMLEIAPEGSRRQKAFVFPGSKEGRPLSAMSLTMRMRALNNGQYTPHGFRSSFRDWAGDATSYPRELCEQALAHIVSGVEGSYRRGSAIEKRRSMMADWSRFLTSKSSENVIQIRA